MAAAPTKSRNHPKSEYACRDGETDGEPASAQGPKHGGAVANGRPPMGSARHDHLLRVRAGATLSSASLPLTKLAETSAHPIRASTTDEMGTVVGAGDAVSQLGTMRARAKVGQESDTLTVSDDWAPRARVVPSPTPTRGAITATSPFGPPGHFPSLATLERVAGNALYFEQYYDALTRCPPTHPLRAQRAAVDISSFELGRVIGQGAFGVVHIATERRRERIVAIKQLRKTDLLRMGQEGHVRAEKDLLSAAASLRGVRWIPSLHYAFQDTDHLFLVLEYMGGGDLLTLLMTRGTLPEGMMRFYAAEMVLALHQVHSLGYIHRDVKPDNFLFTSDGHIRIADFGLATDLHWAHDSSYYEYQRRVVLMRHGVPLPRPAFGNRRRRFATGPNGPPQKPKLMPWRKARRRLAYTICGTNSYMAPEVIRGQGYGFGADWWGVGIIVYEGLFGTVPFVGSSRQAARQRILDWKVNLKFPKAPRASPLAVDFMRKLLCEPADRLGSIPPVKRRGSVSSGNATVAAAADSKLESDTPLGRDGVEALKAHPWFFGIDWERMHTLRAPYAPNLASPADTKHFDDDIPNEPLAPANSALDLRDPLLGNTEFGPAVIAIRKDLAFRGWTYRSPSSCEHEYSENAGTNGAKWPSTPVTPSRTRQRSASAESTARHGTTESSGVTADAASRRALYAPSHTTVGMTDDATGASRRAMYAASDTSDDSDSVRDVLEDIFHDAAEDIGVSDNEALVSDDDVAAYVPRHARPHPSYRLEPREPRVGRVRRSDGFGVGDDTDGQSGDENAGLCRGGGAGGHGGSVGKESRNGSTRVLRPSPPRAKPIPEKTCDRGGEMVRWEEIVSDKAAADAAVTSAGSTFVAAARRRLAATRGDKPRPPRRRLTLRTRTSATAPQATPALRHSVAVT